MLEDEYEDYSDYYEDAAHESFIEEVERYIKDGSRESVKTYLGEYGDAVDSRVNSFLAEADEHYSNGYYGTALTLAAAGLEVMIRFLLLRPLLEGAFLSNEWADILLKRIVSGRSADDRDLLPAVLRQWGIDITNVVTDSGIRIWEFTIKSLWPARNDFVHKGGRPHKDLAASSIPSVPI